MTGLRNATMVWAAVLVAQWTCARLILLVVHG